MSDKCIKRMGFFGFLGKVGKVIGKTIEVGKRVGGFLARHHQTLAPLAHGLAVASGNETPAKITGLGQAASKTLALRQNLDKVNAQAAQQRDIGGSGVFNQMTGKYGNQT
jgi:hypothetical protein